MCTNQFTESEQIWYDRIYWAFGALTGETVDPQYLPMSVNRTGDISLTSLCFLLKFNNSKLKILAIRIEPVPTFLVGKKFQPDKFNGFIYMHQQCRLKSNYVVLNRFKL